MGLHGWYWVSPGDDWSVTETFDFCLQVPIETAQVDGSRIGFRVPRSPWAAPGKPRFSLLMGAAVFPGLTEDLSDVRAFRDRTADDLAVSPSVPPSESPTVKLEWNGLFDEVPDADRGSAWLAFDGTVSDESSTGSFRSPLVSADTTERILDQPARDIRSPRIARLRSQTEALFANYPLALASMPAFDGIGPLEDASMFDGVLEQMRDWIEEYEGAYRPEECRWRAAAVGAATFLYIAERAEDPELRAAAAELADGYYDFAASRASKRRPATHAIRAPVDRVVRVGLEGFAW